MFSRDDGKKVSPDWLTGKWKVWHDAKGLDPRIRLQDLRGTFVTVLIDSGENPKTVQKLARHADITTTFDVYAQAVEPMMRQAVEGLANLSDEA